MAIHVEVDEKLMEEITRRFPISNRNAAVNMALMEWISQSQDRNFEALGSGPAPDRRPLHDLRELKGSMCIDPDYDYKRLRTEEDKD